MKKKYFRECEKFGADQNTSLDPLNLKVVSYRDLLEVDSGMDTTHLFFDFNTTKY